MNGNQSETQSSDSRAFQVLGHHLLVELYGCASCVLNKIELLERAMVEAAQFAGASVVETIFHRFSPHGLSGVLVISESHITVHTWPEHSYAAVDIFTCGKSELGDAVKASLVRAFEARDHRTHAISRGVEAQPV